MVQQAAAAVLGLASALFTFAAAFGITHSVAASVIASLAVAAVVARATATGWLFTFDEGACPRSLKTASAIVSVLGLILLTRLTIFMIDPSQVSCSVNPLSQSELRHSCLTAYHIAGERVGKEDVYSVALYNAPDDNSAAPRRPKTLGPFNVDVFEYPPQFLLLPRAFQAITPDFMDLRPLWFGFSGAVLLAGVIVVAAQMGGAIGTRALLLSPLLWIAVPSTLSTLQKGNIQIVIIASAMIAMVLFGRGRTVAGAVLLSFAIVSKLWPGMLIVYLLARREWRAVSWTAAFALLWSGIALALFGWDAYATFLNHAPGLLSGEAFPAFRNPGAMAINLSLPNILFKLKLFGFPGATFEVAKVLGWIYTVIAVAAAVWAARRPWQAHEQPLVWMAILTIATFRSPFLPFSYGVIPGLWLLTLVAATWTPTSRSMALTGLAFLALTVNWPMDWVVDPRLLAVASLTTMAVMLAITIRALRPGDSGLVAARSERRVDQRLTGPSS